MEFSIKDFFSKCDQISEEILTGKPHFLCSAFRGSNFTNDNQFS